ncbi:unnamed protein product [Arabidopsis arenosa]|uniref:Farnesyl pyrophosphate synthase n=1 Tax=Arabidopsis arenosa TaxID=38785 RepID=A0A8S2ABG9_ARAAE|nr:unnamed protein product [Arabidopsis arenosa]
MSDLKSTFLNAYSVLKSDIFHDPSFEFTDEFRLWLELVSTLLRSHLPPGVSPLMKGEDLENHVDVKNVFVDIGIYFQVQDNYLDWFADPETLGKIGTKIEDFTWSWNDRTMVKPDPSNAAKVKNLYKELDLEEVFMEYGSKTYEKLKEVIEAHQSKTI